MTLKVCDLCKKQGSDLNMNRFSLGILRGYRDEMYTLESFDACDNCEKIIEGKVLTAFKNLVKGEK